MIRLYFAIFAYEGAIKAIDLVLLFIILDFLKYVFTNE